MRVVVVVWAVIFGCVTACGSSGEGSAVRQDDPTDAVLGETSSRVRYASDRTHSPITAAIATTIRAIASAAADRNDDMFMKVGDSITESFAVMACFADGTVELAGRTDLQPTIDFYRSARISGASPCGEEWCRGSSTALDRASYAAQGGATADFPLASSPLPLDQEDAAIRPRIALVQFGTNDATLITTAADVDGFVTFHDRMHALVDSLTSRGIVPVLYTIPPYVAPRPGFANVPTMNAIIRVIAQGRAIPLIDFERELMPLPDYGLWDGTHPKVEFGGCVFTSAGLQYGYNVRNLISMQALARVKHVLDGGGALDSGSSVSGAGSASSPFAVDGLPFVDAHETGPKTYRLEILSSTRVRFLALMRRGRATVAVTNGATLVAAGNAIVHATLPAGAYDITVSGGAFGFVVVRCDSADATCD